MNIDKSKAKEIKEINYISKSGFDVLIKEYERLDNKKHFYTNTLFFGICYNLEELIEKLDNFKLNAFWGEA